MLLEVLFVLETTGGHQLNVDRFLPRTPIRVVVDHVGRPVTDTYPVEELEAALRTGFMEDLLNNEVLMETLLPNMLAAAATVAEPIAEVEINRGIQAMRNTLDHEIGRLATLAQKNNHIRPEEIKHAVQEREALTTLIREASIRLDAVQLIQQGALQTMKM